MVSAFFGFGFLFIPVSPKQATTFIQLDFMG